MYCSGWARQEHFSLLIILHRSCCARSVLSDLEANIFCQALPPSEYAHTIKFLLFLKIHTLLNNVLFNVWVNNNFQHTQLAKPLFLILLMTHTCRCSLWDTYIWHTSISLEGQVLANQRLFKNVSGEWTMQRCHLESSSNSHRKYTRYIEIFIW